MSVAVNQSSGYRHPFFFAVHYFGGVGDNPRTLTELAMCEYSADLRRNSDWWKHFQNKGTREAWASIAQRRVWTIRTPSSFADVHLSPKQIEYVLDELAGYSALIDHENRCQISCFERIWESEHLLDSAAAAALNHELSNLRNQPLMFQDTITTLLINPFLHCLVYNRTLVSSPLNRHLPPRPLPSPSAGDIYTMSPQFAFLPSEILVSSSGVASFASYINNLHPSHTTLYAHFETVLTSFLPLFEHTLTDLHRSNPLVQRIQGSYKYIVWDEPDEPEFSDDDEGWAAFDREMRHWEMNRPIYLPDIPDTGYPGGLECRNYVVSLKGRKLQVILQVSDTRLRPGGPGFPGTPWHVEGMRNEGIVACGLYFPSVENITSTSLQFRMAVNYPRGFSAGDTGATLRTWGLRDGDSCHQYIGSRPVHSGLAIVFPNIYQHRQTSFTLLNPSRPGHQTVIAFFLVDPELQPIVSTAMVAPQQKHWIKQALDESLDRRVPMEVVERIMDYVEGVMEVDEAENYGRALMQARETFRDANNNYHFCIPFDIWSAPEFWHY
ncbi:hypothetical protein L208DRAFT_350947 [Tricholoma matsutake]|nr:hypothetical protein L208DRAFT_1300860 [Tricholoma matsutake 945]KAF8226659.1 hypothetical protein L208DRAFT_350947 [Tricholoma matsutake 945]